MLRSGGLNSNHHHPVVHIDSQYRTWTTAAEAEADSIEAVEAIAADEAAATAAASEEATEVASGAGAEATFAEETEEDFAEAIVVDSEAATEVDFEEETAVAAGFEAGVEVDLARQEGERCRFRVSQKILNSSRRIFEDPTQATAIDARLAQPDQNALIQAFSGMSLQHTELPLRPGGGTLGTPVKLRSNYFAVKVPRGPLHEYDVKLTPPVTIRRVKRRIFALLELSPAFAPYRGAVAHDFSAKLIAAKKLPQPAVFEVPFYDEDESGPPAQGGKTYTVEVTYIQDIDLGALMNYLTGDLQYRDIDIGPVLAALNIVLAQHPGRNGVMVGTSRRRATPYIRSRDVHRQ